MHGAILATTRHGGHFPNSAILSSTFSYSVFCISCFTNSVHMVCVYMCMYVCTVCICVLMYVCACCVCSREISYCFKYIIIHKSLYTIAV